MSQLQTLLASSRLDHRFDLIYGDRSAEAKQTVVQRLTKWLAHQSKRSTDSSEGASLAGAEFADFHSNGQPPSDGTWSEADVVLITYGDQVRSTTANPLRSLRAFLVDQQLPELINTVHFLPFFPSSSDDGFSVEDYRMIDPEFGDWQDVRQFGKVGGLMFDFVVNHVSQRSAWFQGYLKGEAPFDRYFIEADPNGDYSQVTRPRSLPLLTRFETADRGTRFVWTTFSDDQIDLNYSEPRLLAEVLTILLEYVQHGARIIRLDAIAYLWKQLGTHCIHLAETHEVVKLMREVLTAFAPDVLLLTETNVPHDENVSYFGDGDEAHMVYQFSLPPLLLDAFLNDDAQPLKTWLRDLARPPAGCTFFNFTASHDGVGVRPLEGRVDDLRLARLVEKIRARGGLIGTRRQPDGTDAPYELNISYVDALKPDAMLDDDSSVDPQQHAARFLATQAIMMSLQGMPAIYFHSLVGTQNDTTAAVESGINRRINRRKFESEELTQRISEPGSLQQLVYDGIKRLLSVRIQQPAFHPDATQAYLESDNPHVLCFERSCLVTGQTILVAVNFGSRAETVSVGEAYATATDLLGADGCAGDGSVSLQPAQVVWLRSPS